MQETDFVEAYKTLKQGDDILNEFKKYAASENIYFLEKVKYAKAIAELI